MVVDSSVFHFLFFVLFLRGRRRSHTKMAAGLLGVDY